MKENVVLVDMNGDDIGVMEKMQAHQTGKLHLAFSIFIFNSKGELLLQQRSPEKYHSGGLWTNTCCSHPKPEETTLNAANRRLMEEMGLSCELKPVFNFTYLAALDKGLIEHEFDHVFFGFTDDVPILNSDEAIAFKYLTVKNLIADLKIQPKLYTEWLKICFDKVVECYDDLIKVNVTLDN